MNWHTRYTQQAAWTRDLRSYIFQRIGLENGQAVLEVGCGTGAVLAELPNRPGIHGLDIDRNSLFACRLHVPEAILLQGDALQLPCPEGSFDIVYSHFLLLWVRDPLRALREMRRVTRPGRHVMALAEPDYSGRIDRPQELEVLGKWQNEALQRQGADPGLGRRLAELFFEAGITIVETGSLRSERNELPSREWEIEWDVIESDLKGLIPETDIRTMKHLDRQAWEQGTRILHVPTYFAWGRV